MNLFNDISNQEFIEQVWQQDVYVARQTLLELKQIIDGNYLAGLACENEIESRIIFGHKIDDDWDCEHGPFSEEYFANLSETDWTLLVQGVDQYEPRLTDILNRFNFLPRWRLEDIMASYATLGGGVGPHFDYYDVFIIQISGNREWKIGPTCNEQSALQDNNQIKLLSTFECKDTHILEAGDMIYIPAGIAHWGTALSADCISLSIGFRAPSEKNLLIEILNKLLAKIDDDNILSDSIRYRDTKESIDSHPNKINSSAQDTVLDLLSKLDDGIFKSEAINAFGQLVTETKYECLDDDHKTWVLEDLISLSTKCKSIKLIHAGNSRFAFTEDQLYINGLSYDVKEEFSMSVCDKSIDNKMTNKELEVLLELLNQGFVKIEN